MPASQQILSYLKTHPQASADQLATALNVTRRTVFRSLKRLKKEGKIIKSKSGTDITYTLTSAPTPKSSPVKSNSKTDEPPLIDIEVTNPVTYLKRWWQRVIGGEGIDFHFRIRPLTAIALTIVIATFGFGVGRISLSTQEPYLKYTPPSSPAPTPTPNPWRETAFTGILKFSKTGNRYYLLTASSEAINLDVPDNIALSQLVGRRIFATGRYNESTRTLVVTETEDLEILPQQAIPVPTTNHTPTPTPSLAP